MESADDEDKDDIWVSIFTLWGCGWVSDVDDDDAVDGELKTNSFEGFCIILKLL